MKGIQFKDERPPGGRKPDFCVGLMKNTAPQPTHVSSTVMSVFAQALGVSALEQSVFAMLVLPLRDRLKAINVDDFTCHPEDFYAPDVFCRANCLDQNKFSSHE